MKEMIKDWFFKTKYNFMELIAIYTITSFIGKLLSGV